MPKVTFQPAALVVEAQAGSPLLDAARLAGISVETPCGGRGSCGKCLVRILSGEVECSGGAEISPAMKAEGWVLLCRTSIKDTDVTVNTFYDENAEQGRFFDHTEDFSAIDPALLPAKDKAGLGVKTARLTVAQPAAGDGLSDFDRLMAAATCADFAAPSLDILRALPETLRAQDGAVTLKYLEENGRARMLGLRPGHGECGEYGLAIDIGTTTAAVILTGGDGRIIGEKTGYNSQIACGLDVISRINYAKKAAGLRELRERILTTINAITASLCGQHGVDTGDIYAVSIAANTTMVHLLLGVAPEYIRLDPYTPAIYAAPVYTAGQAGILAAADAPVYIAPSVGSYLGGDITAGLMCTSICTGADDIALFIDIGTNGEIVIGNGEFMMGCACSAGPAFEGGSIKHGMRASLGAVERVEIDPGTGAPSLAVIGDAPVKGICGSGMISLVAELFRKGLLDPSGRFAEGRCDFVRDKKYIIAGSDQSDTGGEITVSEADIGNIIRAKAAIFSACRTMLGGLGLEFSDLARIYVSGGFGRYLNIGDARTIGLLPNLDDSMFSFIGNSSLLGAHMALVSPEHRQRQAELAASLTYIDLSCEPGYMDEYMGALFLPHTDMTLFE